MEKRAQGSQKRSEDSILKRSPFDLILNQIQRKTASVGKRERPSVTRFFKGLAEEKSKAEKKKEIKTGEANNSIADGHHQDVSETGESELPGPETADWRKVKQFCQKLGKKPNSKSMNLNNCGLTVTDIMELVALLPLLPDVEELDVSWNDFIGGTLRPLTLELHRVSQLKILRLSNCRLTADDTDALGQALKLIPHLEEMDLSWNGNIGGNLHPIVQRFQKGCSLKVLRLIDCNLTADDGISLAQALDTMQNLEVLDLSMNKHIGCSLRIIAQELKNIPNLNALKLHMCGLLQDHIQFLSTAFQYLPDLRKLDLSCNKEAGGGFKDSAPLATLKQLQVLDLHQCCITEADMVALTQVIPLLASLEVLNISSNKNIGRACEHLLSRLRFLPKLKSVFVNNCALQEGSFTALAEATLHLSGMEELDLSWNKCVGGNLKKLLDAMSVATDLQVLSLNSCNLVTEDLAELASVIQAGHLERLQKLDLSYNDSVADEGWTVFFQCLHKLKDLSDLDISLRPLSSRYCGAWFGSLLASLIKMPTLTDFGVQRWVLTTLEQRQLESFNKKNKRDIHFDCCCSAQDITK
ncbi:leucine-rich repeat-containing protein 31 isoform X2 [Rhinatrema bivittatum]|uniref:leucine-rich repeat-containing protein 31 isoform X2 n=1 Tax=Rhinatrema bivittatum TaxID=194408 RepID=UPI00112AF15B|nr:leucine-rich repeat-containing protein 31 isoform X2 [Rhinatrema bivittatum]